MNILVTGASGFIATHIVSDLMARGHNVTCCVRNISYTQTIFPSAKVIPCDFVRDINVSNWLPRLEGIDAVINTVGIFYHPKDSIIWAVHYDTPKALFEACVAKGIKNVIQISALGANVYDVEYAKSKKALEDFLLSLDISARILRPSFVYGKGSYGGSSLFRGLVALPYILPIPGKGTQEFQPIHVEDLAKAVVNLVETPGLKPQILTAVGPEKVSLSNILLKMRDWLGFAKAKIISTPLFFLRFGAMIGAFFPGSMMNPGAYKMLSLNNTATKEETKLFQDMVGFVPRSYSTGLFSYPSSVQDRWHARLFFLKPALRLSLAFLWILTAFSSAFFYNADYSYQLLSIVGVSTNLQPVLLYGASLLNLLIGIGLLLNYKIKQNCILQLILIVFYTLIISWKLPLYWVEPFGPVSKNIPILVAIMMLLAMESDR